MTKKKRDSPDKDERLFEGFDIPEQNWFKMPSEWTDITAEITSLAELKVVEYVLKHTWGYQEFGVMKKITTNEFMHGRRHKDGTRIDKGTALSNRSVIDGLRKAVEHGLLVEEVDDSDKGRVQKYYSLRMKSQAQDGRNRAGVKKLHTRLKNLHPDVKKAHSRGEESSHRSEKDTVERNTNVKSKNADEKIEYFARVLAEILDDEKSLSFYKQVCRRHDPHRLIQKAKAIVSDGGARNPAAVFVSWLKNDVQKTGDDEKG